MTPILEGIYGNRAAAQVLLFIQAYGSGYASRIATIFDTQQTSIYRQLIRLEASGVLVSRTVGKTRVFEFNDRNPSVRNLRQSLARELDLLPDDQVKKYFRQRQRPRRTGKRL
ncbi:MAG: ArsR family transcriptional regulator [Coriobacteriia bacterium]|nr:ArsR family transcriptional regulator [Coriobacteriia bacterium]